MSSRALLGAVTVAVALAALSPAAAADIPRPGEQGVSVPGELIVKFEPGVSAAERGDGLRDGGAAFERRLRIPRTVLATARDGADVDRTVRALERDPRVAWAEPNPYRWGGAMPNDELLGIQWGLHNSGQAILGKTGAAGADIDALQAWDLATGSPDVKVAVVDSGINLDHPDLAPNVWRNPGESGGGRESNGLDDDGNGLVDDLLGWDFVGRDNDPADNFGHGTQVAGTIAARGNDGVGVTGVAWRASLIPVRALDNANRGACSEIADAMAYAVRAGARVVNMSIGAYEPCQAERDVMDASPNTLFVAAAMNDGLDVDAQPAYPCSYSSPNVVCVAATDSSDRLAGFSNHGAQSVDLAAPGVNVASVYLKWGPAETLYTDGFEGGPLDGWVTGGSPDTWVRTPFAGSRGGAWALSNSALGLYSNGTDNWAQLDLDLEGLRNCLANVWVKHSLGVVDPAQPLDSHDRLMADLSPDGVSWGHMRDGVAGTSQGFHRWPIDLSAMEGRLDGGLRLRLIANAADTYEGVALDDVEVVCAPPLTSYTGERDEYVYDGGTSFAAPHVSGVAVLLLSQHPGLTAAELKARILSTVDPVPGLAGRTVTGGRLNAARALIPPAAAAQAPGPASSGGATQAPPSGASIASALAAQVRALARALEAVGIRALVRRGGLFGAGLLAPAPGRLTLKLKRGGRTMATGACAVSQAGRCPFDIRLTRRGRSMLRHARRLRITLVLAFAPRSGGRPVVRRTTVTLRRAPTKPRQGASR
jgi:thermitase